MLWMLFQLITEVRWEMWRTTDRPCGSDHSGQKSPLLLQTKLHDSWCLKLLSDPLALLQIINEHKLDTDMLTVGHLEERGEALMAKCRVYQRSAVWPNKFRKKSLIQDIFETLTSSASLNCLTLCSGIDYKILFITFNVPLLVYKA